MKIVRQPEYPPHIGMHQGVLRVGGLRMRVSMLKGASHAIHHQP
jgi:hypothetical protein